MRALLPVSGNGDLPDFGEVPQERDFERMAAVAEYSDGTVKRLDGGYGNWEFHFEPRTAEGIVEWLSLSDKSIRFCRKRLGRSKPGRFPRPAVRSSSNLDRIHLQIIQAITSS